MDTLTQQIMSYPYWPRDKTQDANRIAGGLVAREIQDIGINRVPMQQDYSSLNIPVLMRPVVRQDTSQMTTQADRVIYGVGNPGGLYSSLLASVPDVNPKKGTGKDGN